ncbi:MAG TPA: zinc-binding dehydrogenase, partial [Citricoccus sp.]
LEGAGIVLAVGDGVEGFTEGDAVLGAAARGEGTFADHALLSAPKSVAKPEEVSFPDAAVLPVAGAVAYDVVHQADLGPGGTLVVLGAGGGVGLMAVQAARAGGLRVIGVASDAKRGLVESAGAEFITSGDGAAERVRELAPDGADLVVDLVGGQALRDIAPAVKRPAQIITTVDPVTAEQLGGSALRRTAGALEAVTELVRQRVVDPHVRRRFSLSDAHEAMAIVEAGHAAGKVVIEP